MRDKVYDMIKVYPSWYVILKYGGVIMGYDERASGGGGWHYDAFDCRSFSMIAWFSLDNNTLC